jgi:hypothetical protein
MIKFQTISINDKNDFHKVPNGFVGLMTKNHIGKKVVSSKLTEMMLFYQENLKKSYQSWI